MVLVQHLAQLFSESLRLDDIAVVATIDEVSETENIDLVRLKSPLLKHQIHFFLLLEVRFDFSLLFLYRQLSLEVLYPICVLVRFSEYLFNDWIGLYWL